jgi:hypothetical protein
MKEEMDKLEEEQNGEHTKVADWAASWDPMAFASEEEREEAEIRHEIKTEEMKIRAAEEKKKVSFCFSFFLFFFFSSSFFLTLLTLLFIFILFSLIFTI